MKTLKQSSRAANFATDNNFYGARRVINKENGESVLDARFYVSRSGNTLWCRAWYKVNEQCGYGVGKATGWGYDRESSAFVNALADMGIEKGDLHKKDIEGGIGMDAVLSRMKENGMIGKDTFSFCVGS